MNSWREIVSRWFVAYELGVVTCGVGCKVWLDNRAEIMQLVRGGSHSLSCAASPAGHGKSFTGVAIDVIVPSE